MVPDEEAARELVQEAILQAFLSLDRLREVERFKSWLYGIMINICRGYLRASASDGISLEDLAEGEYLGAKSLGQAIPDPQQVAEERELTSLIRSAIGELSPNNRQVVLLYYYRNLSLQEIAASLGVSIQVIKVRLHRARKQLGKFLVQSYPEIDLSLSAELRRNTMIRVNIADIYRKEDAYIVLLLDESERWALPIWIGRHEALSITAGLRGFSTARPMTYNFIASLLDAIGAELVEARVEALKKESFYGVAKLRSGGQVREVDARPSDILALAVRTGSPIFVGEEVMERAGIDLGERNGNPLRLGDGIDALLVEIQESWQARSARPCAEVEEDPRQGYEEILQYVLKSAD
jgi:RNA polymerase sigma factor (sigma-70 family)